MLTSTKKLLFSIAGFLYSSGACAAAAARSTDDSLNYGFGGALFGAFMGLRAKSIHSVVVNSVALFAGGAGTDYIANHLFTRPTKERRQEQVEKFHRSISSTPNS